MKIEDIEKAAIETAKKACDDFEEAVKYANGFMVGAEWRINSVWHDAKTDVPEAHFPVLVEDYLGDSEVSMLAPKEECPKSWVRWAYIDDLLPKEEE